MTDSASHAYKIEHDFRLIGNHATMNHIPQDFRDAHFKDYVRIATGQAVIGAQFVERVLNGICLLLNADGLSFKLEDWTAGDSARTKQMLGRIVDKLGQTGHLNEQFIERLREFSTRRNRVVHGLFVDTFQNKGARFSDQDPQALAYVSECDWIAEEAAQLVDTAFGIFWQLGSVMQRRNPCTKMQSLLDSFAEFRDVGEGAVADHIRH